MDGDDVESEPSEPVSLTEFFTKLFPVYMAKGMSYEEYWLGPVWLAKAYREAWEMKIRQEEWARHRQAAYIFEALLCAAPVLKPFVKDAKPGKFPEQPWPLTQREADEQQAERDRRGYEMALARRKAEIKMRMEQAQEQGADDDGDD